MADKKQKAPAYVSYLTFQKFIKSLHETACPPNIDRSVMTGISGGNQGALLATLGFLGLTDHGGRVTDEMKSLIEAYGTDKWGAALSDVISDAYLDILDGVDLDSGTYKQLRDAFKKNGEVDGQVLDKCLRFYLAGQKDARISLSPHFKRPRASPTITTTTKGQTKNSKKTKGRKKSERQERHPDSSPDIPDGYTEFPLRDGRKVIVPADLTARDVKTITAYLNAYAGEAPD